MGHPKLQRANERPPLKVRERELLDRHDVGRLLSVSPSLVSNWHRDGVMPSPIERGGMTLWRRRELEDWCSAGCPPRDSWDWKPSMPVKLETLIDQLTDEAIELGRMINELKARRAAGDTSIHIRK